MYDKNGYGYEFDEPFISVNSEEPGKVQDLSLLRVHVY